MNLGIETEQIEFKKTTGELKEAIISLSSMLNKNGYGTVFFGVKDNGEIIGQQVGSRTLREISQGIASFIRPQIIPTITLELKDDKNVISVNAEGCDRPYSAYGRYYMRSADEDRELSPEQLRILLNKKSEQDPTAKMASERDDLTFGQLKTLFALKGLSVNPLSFYENAGLLTPDGHFNAMAELLADENDISIKVVSFRGKDKTEVIKRNEYGKKCILLAMDQVITYMESINDTFVRIGTHQREEEKLFDMASFHEAWINACLHTKWERKNPPAVYIFSDRIEIISTGGLPADLTKEEFYKGISRPVNRRLQKIFGQLGYVEQTGHGVPLIVSQYGRQAFDVMQNFINVTIPFNKNQLHDRQIISPINEQSELNDAQRKILQLLTENPTYTIKELVGLSGMSDGYVRKNLGILKQKNRILRIGSNKTGYWNILK